MKLSQATWAGKVGNTKQLTITAVPADADNAEAIVSGVAYASDNEAVATVAEDGTMTAVTAGSANITATSGDFTATCKATITAV
ncbi:Ig-like domain-containing protein [Lapidilactobacillus dextrinicus]|uniref:Ig-like domain-containing protein n=1 Tax=Lapidilactobacillus dextrinicus TaxID=51664 RepID=UPI003F24B03C